MGGGGLGGRGLLRSPPRAPRRGRGDLQVRPARLAGPGGRPVRRVGRGPRRLASDQRGVARASSGRGSGVVARARAGALGDRRADQRGPRGAVVVTPRGVVRAARRGHVGRGRRHPVPEPRGRAAPQGTRQRGEGPRRPRRRLAPDGRRGSGRGCARPCSGCTAPTTRGWPGWTGNPSAGRPAKEAAVPRTGPAPHAPWRVRATGALGRRRCRCRSSPRIPRRGESPRACHAPGRPRSSS